MPKIRPNEHVWQHAPQVERGMTGSGVSAMERRSGMISFLCILVSILSWAPRRFGFWDMNVEFVLGLHSDFMCDSYSERVVAILQETRE